MKNRYFIKIKGLAHDEQTSLIMTNLRDNLLRLKAVMIIFVSIQFINLILLFFPGLKIVPIEQQQVMIRMFLSVLVFGCLFIGLLHLMGGSVNNKRILFFRLIISTGLMLLLFWGVILKITGYESAYFPNYYLMMMISFAAVLFFSYWEIVAVTLPSQIFITFLVFSHKPDINQQYVRLLINTWGFVFLAVLISSLIYYNRVQYLKKDLQLTKQNNLLKLYSENDALTNVYNRRKLDEVMEIEWKRSNRTLRPFSFLLIDLDNFKKYNDAYGHIEGDLCLRKSAAIMKNTLRRSSDKIFRYGGEEFGIILPFTDIKAAKIVAEKLRRNIENAQIMHRDSELGFLTISIGITDSQGIQSLNYPAMYTEADKALYVAKRSGRNKVIAFEK